MLAGSQHESKSHLVSQEPSKLQMYTVKAKPSTNRSEEVNSLWARQNSCAGEDSQLYRGCAQIAVIIKQMYFTLILHVTILI